MNRTTFLAYARRAPFGGRLTQSQIDGMNAILDEWDRRQSTAKVIDNRWLAHMLATVFHETGRHPAAGDREPQLLGRAPDQGLAVALPDDRQRQALCPKPAQAGEQGLANRHRAPCCRAGLHSCAYHSRISASLRHPARLSTPAAQPLR